MYIYFDRLKGIQIYSRNEKLTSQNILPFMSTASA